MNFKRKKPRRQSRSRGCFPENPGWFDAAYNNRPKRRCNKSNCLRFMKNAGTEIVWDLGNGKPRRYYW